MLQVYYMVSTLPESTIHENNIQWLNDGNSFFLTKRIQRKLECV